MDTEPGTQGGVAQKTKRSLSFSPGDSAAVEQASLGSAGADVPEPPMAPARKVKLDPLARAGVGSALYSMSPQYKMPWVGRREEPGAAKQDKAQQKGAAASLSARFQDAPAREAEGDSPRQQIAGNDDGANAGFVEAEQRVSRAELQDWKASPPAREDPSAADGRSEGDARGGSTVGASTRSSLSDTSIVQRAHHLVLDGAEDGEEVEKQHHAPGAEAPSVRMPIDPSTKAVAQRAGIQDFLQAATEAAPASDPGVPEKWKEDPVFQGMEYVGCGHQYTPRHYARFLARQAQEAEAAVADG